MTEEEKNKLLQELQEAFEKQQKLANDEVSENKTEEPLLAAEEYKEKIIEMVKKMIQAYENSMK